MQVTRHLYAIAGLIAVLTALSVGSSRPQTKGSATSVLVTNTNVPVSISNTPSVKLQNSASSPLLVRDVDVSSRIHVEKTAIATFEDTIGLTLQPYTVPAGKRLIIEGLSVRGSCYSDNTFTRMTVSSGSFFYPLEFQAQPADHNTDLGFVANMNAPFQVGSGQVLNVSVAVRKVGYASVSACFTGYLIDEPVPAP